MKTLLNLLELNIKSVYGLNATKEMYTKYSKEIKNLYKAGKIYEAEEIVLNFTR
jgi:hypothetical protein